MSVGRMHVVRHSFEPSGQLEKEIRDFAGSYVRPGFLLRSTKEVYIDSATYARGGYPEAARTAIEQAKRTPFIIARAAMSLLYAQPSQATDEDRPPVGYRMFFQPDDQNSFNYFSSSLDAYLAVKPRSQSPRHYLFLDLPVAAAHLPHREEAEAAFKSTIAEGLTRRLFSATITGVRSMEVPFTPAPHAHTVGRAGTPRR